MQSLKTNHRRTDFKLVHGFRGGITARQCICCNRPITGRNFSGRTPENKLELCREHLHSYNIVRRLDHERKVSKL